MGTFPTPPSPTHVGCLPNAPPIHTRRGGFDPVRQSGNILQNPPYFYPGAVPPYQPAGCLPNAPSPTPVGCVPNAPPIHTLRGGFDPVRQSGNDLQNPPCFYPGAVPPYQPAGCLPNAPPYLSKKPPPFSKYENRGGWRGSKIRPVFTPVLFQHAGRLPHPLRGFAMTRRVHS